MRQSINRSLVAFVILSLFAVPSLPAQSRGLQAIRAAEMRVHLEFLSAREFEGRSAPSAAVNIASRYIALQAQRIGLKPLLPGGSYLQPMPVEVTTLSPAQSKLRILFPGGGQSFDFPRSFGVNVRGGGEGVVSGGLVFLGTLLNGPAADWTKLTLPDIKGKIAMILEVPAPAPASSNASPAGSPAMNRARFLREKGAVGLLTVISAEREKNLADSGLSFDIVERLRFPDIDTSIPGAAAPAPTQNQPGVPFFQADLRHEAGVAIMGMPWTEFEAIIAGATQGQTVGAKDLSNRTAEISLYYETRKTTTSNVVAWIEGTDARLKAEYVTISSHHDHLPMREGRIFPGADDNNSGVAAMLSLAQAMMIERPKRSVIFVWNTAEEKGLIGSYYFVQHCPVPVEKISANLNFDMISRNDPNMIYLIGSNKLSSELDAAIHAADDRSVRMKLDYTFESPTHSDQFFFRSDQYPYIRYGIPGVWFFCGTTPDYHTDGDTLERMDLAKAEKVAKLVYLTCWDIGSKPALLKLDLNPEITTRGPANMKINWRNPPPPPEKK
jgi:hypothetical protein